MKLNKISTYKAFWESNSSSLMLVILFKDKKSCTTIVQDQYFKFYKNYFVAGAASIGGAIKSFCNVASGAVGAFKPVNLSRIVTNSGSPKL